VAPNLFVFLTSASQVRDQKYMGICEFGLREGEERELGMGKQARGMKTTTVKLLQMYVSSNSSTFFSRFSGILSSQATS
jgi:hypothetical protein